MASNKNRSAWRSGLGSSRGEMQQRFFENHSLSTPQTWLPSSKLFILNNFGELAGARTQDQRLKRAMLYQLSYELSPFVFNNLRGG